MPATASTRHQTTDEFATRLARDLRELRDAHADARRLAREFLAAEPRGASLAGCPVAARLLRALKRLQETSAWAAESEHEARRAQSRSARLGRGRI